MGFRGTLAREVEALFAPPAAAVAIGDLAFEGISDALVRADHRHEFPATVAAALDLAAAGAAGADTTAARSDHRHRHRVADHQVGGVADLTGVFAGSGHGHAPELVLNAKGAPFNAVGDGIADDWAALQSFLDACISAGAPATTVRRGIATGYIPPGVYRITAPLTITSVLGFHLLCAGMGDQVRIRPDFGTAATPGKAALICNGVAFSTFENFTVDTSGNEDLDHAILEHWDNATALRSMTRNRWMNVEVRNTRYRLSGWQIGRPGNNLQEDQGHYLFCDVTGQWAAGELTYWQAGFKVGTTVAGNNLIHTFVGCGATHNRRNLHMAQSQAVWMGGIMQTAESDIFLEGMTSYLKVFGLRSEQSQRLLSCVGAASAAALVSLEDIDWNSSSMAADGRWIDFPLGGTLHLKQLRCRGFSGITPVIRAQPTRALLIIVEGLAVNTAFANAFVLGANAKVAVLGYTEVDADATPVAQVQARFPDTTVTGALAHIGTTAGFYNKAPVVQAAAIADATGGAIIDVEARARLNALLAAVRNVGIIAT